MPSYQYYFLALQITWVLFVFAFGACVGSLINVLAYRLPLGLNVVTPPSRCPACGTKLTWRENIPVFGWIFLRGRCRFCKSKISPEYPLVEAFTGMLFAAFFVLWYVTPHNFTWLDVNWGAIKPDWALNDLGDRWPRQTWPMFLVLLAILGSLTAMTLIDAKTFTIPLSLTVFPTVVAVLGHVGYALYLQLTGRSLRFPKPESGWFWSIATPRYSVTTHFEPMWWWAGASIGACVGLGVSMLLVRLKLISRSFEDYAEWEKSVTAAAPAAPPTPESATPAETSELATKPTPESPAATEPSNLAPIFIGIAAAAVFVALATLAAGLLSRPQWHGLVVGVLAGPIIGGIVARMLRRSSPEEAAAAAAEDPTHLWIQYPHARREMIRELSYLGAPVGMAYLGGFLAKVLTTPDDVPPLALVILTGVLMGYLIGGAVVWAVRIGGSLGFGKEAMGLGDVHLMAAVGACVGWIDATLAFFLAAFVGIYWTIISMVWSSKLSRSMPYGPYLAAATVFVLLCKPLIEAGLTRLLQIPPGGMPINLP